MLTRDTVEEPQVRVSDAHPGHQPTQSVTVIVGAMMFGDQTDESVAREIVAHARDHGVNCIHTADVYCKGKSESMVGALIKSRRETGARDRGGQQDVGAKRAQIRGRGSW